MYEIIKFRWMRGSRNSGEYIIASCSRLKEAKGLVRHHFSSELEMITKHQYDWDDYEISQTPEQAWVTLADDEGIYYICKFSFRESSQQNSG